MNRLSWIWAVAGAMAWGAGGLFATASATTSGTQAANSNAVQVQDAAKTAAAGGTVALVQALGGVGEAVGDVALGGPGIGGGMRRFALPGQAQTGTAAAGSQRWNAFVAYSHSDVAFSFAPRQTSGKIDVGVVGVDYTLANRMIVGVAVAGDRSKFALNFNGGNMSGSGWTISPYLAIPLNRNWALDATLGFGRSDVDVNSGGGTGSYRSERTVFSAGATYRNAMGKWLLTGRAAVLSADDRLGSFTLSNGTFVSDGKVGVTQMRLGGQAGYNLGGVVPYVGLTYIYDFRRPDQQPVAGVSAANDRDAWTPTVGIRFNSSGSLYGGIQYSSEQSRSQVKNNQLLFNLGVRF